MWYRGKIPKKCNAKNQVLGIGLGSYFLHSILCIFIFFIFCVIFSAFFWFCIFSSVFCPGTINVVCRSVCLKHYAQSCWCDTLLLLPIKSLFETSMDNRPKPKPILMTLLIINHICIRRKNVPLRNVLFHKKNWWAIGLYFDSIAKFDRIISRLCQVYSGFVLFFIFKECFIFNLFIKIVLKQIRQFSQSSYCAHTPIQKCHQACCSLV